MVVRQLPRCFSQFLLAVSLLFGGTTSFGEVATENQLKAAYLINFLKYVEWPSASGSLNICLFGRDSLSASLANYEGRLINGREVRIRKVNSPEQLADCHELFVPDIEDARFSAILRWVDKQPILTISDAEVFARDGGGVSLVRTEGRLQFDINHSTLNRAGLKASSQMLRLARQVYGSHR